MSTSEDLVRVVPTDDGLLLFGREEDLNAFDTAAGGGTRSLGSQAMAKAGVMLSGVSTIQEQSGRWMKLTDDAVEYMRTHGISVQDVTSGVLRKKDSPLVAGNGGEILKHLTFTKAGLATPAAPAALAAMATEQAIQLALEEIKDYLAEIDAKIDRLLVQPKVEMRGDLTGVAFALDEAEMLMEATGTVNEVAYQKVQSLSFELQKAQGQALAQLDQITRDITKHAGDADELAKVLRIATNDIPFWLKTLAQAISFSDRQSIIELTRVAESDPTTLESHRLGVKNARAARSQKISTALSSMLTAVQESGALNNLARVVHFGDAKRIHQAAEQVRQAVDGFAAHTGLDGVVATAQELTPWRTAAMGLLGDAATGAKQAGTQVKGVGVQVGGQVAGQVGQLNEKVQRRRLSSLQRRAEKLKGKLGKSGSEDSDGTED